MKLSEVLPGSKSAALRDILGKSSCRARFSAKKLAAAMVNRHIKDTAKAKQKTSENALDLIFLAGLLLLIIFVIALVCK